MEFMFDENEIEYKSCERPMCNYTECPEHEEYMSMAEDEGCPFSDEELDLFDLG